MSEKHFIGDWVTRFEDAKAKKPISRVTFMYDDENGFTAGDDTGLEIVASCYFATQAMADNALAALKGYQYHPFSAGAANLDPAAELGDGVTVGGIYSVIAGLNDDGYGFPDVEAPGEAELEEQFPHPGFLTQEVKRKVALGRSYYGSRITRANGLEVVKTEADGTEKSRVKLNSDILAFYNDNGEEALYFDAMTGKYRFRGDVEVTGGSMNINDAFIVDPQGNLTLTGNINLSGGSIIWGSNLPPSGISAATAERIAGTVVSNTLVASPLIVGAEFQGGTYYGTNFNVISDGYEGSFSLYGEYAGNNYHFFEVSYFADLAPYVHIDSPDGGYLIIGSSAVGVSFASDVSFAGVTVTGLDIVFG